MDTRYLKNIDFTLLLTTIAIVAFGCVMIYSAEAGGASGASFVKKQIMYALIGFIVSAIVASIHTSVYQRNAGKIYFFTLLLLVAVLLVGKTAKGAQSWIGFGPIQIQPSEFAKISVIITLAVFLVNRKGTIKSFKTFVGSFIYMCIPMMLIFVQPDLGTSLVLVAIWVVMVFVMGTRIQNLLIFAMAGLILIGIAWTVPGVMKPYQKQRVITFVNPGADPLGSGYHVVQSRIAIGSGQLTGKGFLKGTQRELNFIPEQHTDFIYTVVGEELGFVGSVTVIVLYFILLWRILIIMLATEDQVGRAIGAGVVGMLFFHIFENLGMTLGIMPVTGVPLPMFSYGGSSLMANLMAIGLIQGISIRRHKINF